MNKRVCILTTVHNCNDNRVYYKEVLSLKSLGYDVVYAAKEITDEIDKSIETVVIPQPKSTLRRIFGFYKAYKVVKKLGCEIVHFQDAELIPTGLLLKCFTKTKVIYDVHEDYPAQMLTKFYIKSIRVRKMLNRIMTILEKWAGKRFDAIITADASVYKHFPPEKTTILYNFPSVKLMTQADEKTGAVEKKYDIIFPGSMAKFTAKLFLDVMLESKKRGREIKCILISPFHFDGGKDWVIQTAKEYGVYENLTLMDRIPPYEVSYYMKASRIGLIPLPDTLKMRANIPTKMFEYMFFKLPVLTSDLPPCGRFMRKDEFGYLIKYDDVNAYVDLILNLLDHPDLIDLLGNTGRELVLTKYNWESEEKKLAEVYLKLLS